MDSITNIPPIGVASNSMGQVITARLLIEPLQSSDHPFILELVNTPGWLEFIGDRNIHSAPDAIVYINKIINNPSIKYWVIKLKESAIPIGIVSFIKRDYLQFHDIGFALLSAFANNGYAYEATTAVLTNILRTYKHPQILATTIASNLHSIKLLKKLGMEHITEIEVENEILQVYGAAIDKLIISTLTGFFFDVFTNKMPKQPDFNLLREICIPEVMFINRSEPSTRVYDIQNFIATRRAILQDGTLTGFEERELYHETKASNNTAQRFAIYVKEGVLNGEYFSMRGHKYFQFIKINEAWKISSVL